jgi:hypothetical protein
LVFAVEQSGQRREARDDDGSKLAHWAANHTTAEYAARACRR